MHLPKPFFRLPRHFDASRLRAEVDALPESAWAPHPNGIPGNSSVRLISADGGENDHVEGTMRPTVHLEGCPYVRQILASFGVPWSRSRLLRLAPGVGVPQHSDINYHWFYRVRVHVPVVTRSEVRFHCDGTAVHMAPGEAWVFDNWRLHHVENPTPDARIHLVADTSGNAAFWQLVATSDDPGVHVVDVPYQPGREVRLLTERGSLRPVMNPAELELLVGNLRGDLVAQAEGADARIRLARYHGLLDAFVRDWRQFYSLYGEEPDGWADLARLRDSVRTASRALGEGLMLRANRVSAHQVFEGRVLRACLATGPTPAVVSVPVAPANQPPVPPPVAARPSGSRRAAAACLERPVFIVAAPRSGSTLLFETLTASDCVASLGGEAHWLIETIAELCPGAPGIGSNRLEARQATPRVVDRIRSQVLDRLIDRSGHPLGPDRLLRFVEKTPKNALRIPFLGCVFPDARFVFLWREPRGNLSSIIDAWQSGNWRTYPRLDGFTLPWSLLLPPGWETMRGRPVEDIAAFQWRVTNSTVLDDLAQLPRERWMALNYAEFVATPRAQIERLCGFLDLPVDAALSQRLSAPLPAARHTLAPASPDKWQRHADRLERVLPGVADTWERLKSLPAP